MIVASLPFYWLSLDVPKRIVNEALQGEAFQNGNTTANLFSFSIGLPEFLGGGTLKLLDGYDFDQIGYLQLAELLADAGDSTAAVEALEQALFIFPFDQRVPQQLAVQV